MCKLQDLKNNLRLSKNRQDVAIEIAKCERLKQKEIATNLIKHYNNLLKKTTSSIDKEIIINELCILERY